MREGITLYRVNPKGVKGKWACEEHHKNFDAPPIDPAVLNIAHILEEGAP